MLAAETNDAIAIVFEALGRTNAASSAIDDVVVHALGLPLRDDLAVLLPTFDRPSADGATGLATSRVRRASEILALRDEGAVHARPSPTSRSNRSGASIPMPACTGSASTSSEQPPRRTPAPPSDADRAGPARDLAPDRRERAARCSSSRASTRSHACSSAVRSHSSRRCAIASPTRSSRSRRSTPRSPPRPTRRGC